MRCSLLPASLPLLCPNCGELPMSWWTWCCPMAIWPVRISCIMGYTIHPNITGISWHCPGYCINSHFCNIDCSRRTEKPHHFRPRLSQLRSHSRRLGDNRDWYLCLVVHFERACLLSRTLGKCFNCYSHCTTRSGRPFFLPLPILVLIYFVCTVQVLWILWWRWSSRNWWKLLHISRIHQCAWNDQFQ